MRKNISDSIAQYIKVLISRSSLRQIEIQRAEIAKTFNCVPSQVNYVIRTRFREADGYVTESRRGGQGFIRITQCDQGEDQLAYEALQNCLAELEREGFLTPRETELINQIARLEFSGVPFNYRTSLYHSIIKVLAKNLT